MHSVQGGVLNGAGLPLHTRSVELPTNRFTNQPTIRRDKLSFVPGLPTIDLIRP